LECRTDSRAEQLTVEAPLETGHIVVVGFTAAAFLVFVCTGLVIAVSLATASPRKLS